MCVPLFLPSQFPLPSKEYRERTKKALEGGAKAWLGNKKSLPFVKSDPYLAGYHVRTDTSGLAVSPDPPRPRQK